MTNPARLITVADGVTVFQPNRPGWGFANCIRIEGHDGTVQVDAPYDRHLVQQMEALVATIPETARVKTVVTTHANGDHCYGLYAYPGAEIISTDACLSHRDADPTPVDMERLVSHDAPASAFTRYMRRHFGLFDFSGIPLVPPTRTFSGEYVLRHEGKTIRLLDVAPAHSMGDCMVHLPDQGVVCTGDVVFNGDHPVHWAGPLDNIVRICESVRQLQPDVIVPGHGPVMDVDDLVAYIDYLTYVRAHLHDAYRRGVPATEAGIELIEGRRYPTLGLAERLIVLAGVEYRHLDGGTEPVNLLGLLAEAAEYAVAAEPALYHFGTARTAP